MRPGYQRITGDIVEHGSVTALRALLLSAVVAGSGCGSVAETRSGVDAGASSASMVLAGCSVIGGGIPLPNDSPNATRLTDPVIAPAAPGKALTGSIRMSDAQSDAATLLVQVRGAPDHLVCTISPTERANNRIDLSRLKVMSAATTGTQVVYFAVQDAMGNLGGYVMGTVSFGAPAPIAICGAASGPIQVLGQQVAAPTTQFNDLNGTLVDYVADPNQSLALMALGRIYLDMGTCTTLRVGSDPTGSRAVGWDDVLLVEYRTAPAAPVTKAWFYTRPGAPNIIDVRTSQAIKRGEDATIAGSALAPPVASDSLFGYPGRAIDLMPRVPPGGPVFELTFSALDYYYYGSTTDIWLFAQ